MRSAGGWVSVGKESAVLLSIFFFWNRDAIVGRSAEADRDKDSVLRQLHNSNRFRLFFWRDGVLPGCYVVNYGRNGGPRRGSPPKIVSRHFRRFFPHYHTLNPSESRARSYVTRVLSKSICTDLLYLLQNESSSDRKFTRSQSVQDPIEG